MDRFVIANLVRWLFYWLDDLPCPLSPYCRKCVDCGRCTYHGEPCVGEEEWR
jgi:hypothetical protein